MEDPNSNSCNFRIKNLQKFAFATSGWVISLVFILSHIIGGISDMHLISMSANGYSNIVNASIKAQELNATHTDPIDSNANTSTKSSINKKVKGSIVTSPPNPLIVHILSSNPRSGSSYLAEILSPENGKLNLTSTYLFEPLKWLSFPVPKDDKIAEIVVKNGR